MRLILALALATRFASSALAQMPDTVTQPLPLTVTTRVNVDGVPTVRPSPFFDRGDSARATHRGKHALTGAAIGTAVGIAAGLVSLRNTDLSCSNGTCTHQRNGIVFVTLTLDGVIGAGVGAFLGVLVP